MRLMYIKKIQNQLFLIHVLLLFLFFSFAKWYFQFLYL